MAKNILLIGSGNLAWHFSAALESAGHSVTTVSRSPVAADWAGAQVQWTELKNSNYHAIFLAVPDAAIAEVSGRLAKIFPVTLPVYHTSGATPVTEVSEYFTHRGVLWPVRSLKLGAVRKEWTNLPLVYHGTSGPARKFIRDLAEGLSKMTHELDDDQRGQLHLAAVFSNNFVTWLYQIAFEICEERDIPFEVLLPIIRETAAQQDGNAPAPRQTGAAARGDTETMRRHLSRLTNPAYQRLYRDISRLIFQDRLPEYDPDLGSDLHDDLQN